MVGVNCRKGLIREHLLLPLTPYAFACSHQLKKKKCSSQLMLLSSIPEKTVVIFFFFLLLKSWFRISCHKTGCNHQWHSSVFLDLIATLFPPQGASAGDSDINKISTIHRTLYCESYAAHYASIVLAIPWLRAKEAEPKFSVCLDRMKPKTHCATNHCQE